MMFNMTLGDLHDALDRMPDDFMVRFPIGAPSGLCSYRGFYEQLAVVVDTGATTNVAQFRSWLADALTGREFRGYKGGVYRMKRSTPVWVVLNAADVSDCTVGDIERDRDREIVWLGLKRAD